MTAGGSTTEGPDDDPFAELSLDDEFVRGAKVQEASADDRIERIRRIDAEHAGSPTNVSPGDGRRSAESAASGAVPVGCCSSWWPASRR